MKFELRRRPRKGVFYCARAEMFFPHKSNRSIRAPSSFARPFFILGALSPSVNFHSICLQVAQSQLRRCTKLSGHLFVQESLCFNFVTFLFLLKVYVGLYLFICLLICFVFFYNCSGILAYLSVGLFL